MITAKKAREITSSGVLSSEEEAFMVVLEGQIKKECGLGNHKVFCKSSSLTTRIRRILEDLGYVIFDKYDQSMVTW